MRLEDLKFTHGVPKVSEPTVMFRRFPSNNIIYACEVSPGKVLGSNGQPAARPYEDEYAPLPISPDTLPRVETPEEGKRYECDISAGSTIVLKRSGGHWWHCNGQPIHDPTTCIVAVYGPCPDREPDPPPLENCVVVFKSYPQHYLAKHRAGKIVTIFDGGARSDGYVPEENGWHIAGTLQPWEPR